MASGEKSFLVGCLGVVALIVIFLIGGSVYFGYQGYQAKMDIQKTYSDMVDRYQTLNDEFAFTVPADGLLQPTQVQNFLKVRLSMAEYSKPFLSDIKTAGSDIIIQFRFSGFAVFESIDKIKQAIIDLVKSGANIGNEHCRLLREVRMSPKEYEWITRIYLGTLASGQLEEFPDLQAVWETYKTQFEKERQTWLSVTFKVDKKKIRGDDMNMPNLMKQVQPVVCLSANAQVIRDTMPVVVVDSEATMIDFLALHALSYLAAMKE